MKKLLSLLLIISMISTGAIATFAETVNEDVVISDVAENIEINEEEVSEEVAEEDATVDVAEEVAEEEVAVDVANEDVDATEAVEEVVEVDEEKSEVEEVTEAEASDDLKDEEIGEIVLVPMKEDSSNNETTEVEEDETEATEEELLGASDQVTVTIDPQKSIPHKGIPYKGETKKITKVVKKGSTLGANDLDPRGRVNGYSEKKEDVKKYNFSNLLAGSYSYTQVGWKINNKEEIYRDHILGPLLPLSDKFDDYKINSNMTLYPIWRRSSSVSLETNGGKLSYNAVKYERNNKTGKWTKKIVKHESGSPNFSWSFDMDEGETLEYWTKREEYSNFKIEREGHIFQGWKSLRYNKIFKNFKDYKSEGYYDEIVAQWAKIGRDVNEKGIPYTDKGPFISELILGSSSSEKHAKDQIRGGNWKGNVYFRDLNQDAGGNYIYLGYKMTNNRDEAITNIVVKFGKNSPNTISYGKEKNGKRPTYNVVKNVWGDDKVDVNEKAGGEYIYIYTTKDPKAGKPIKSLESFFENTKTKVKGTTFIADHPDRKTVKTYRKNHFNGDTTVDFAPLVENNASSAKKSVANLNEGATKKKWYKIWKYTSKSFLGLGFRRAKD